MFQKGKFYLLAVSVVIGILALFGGLRIKQAYANSKASSLAYATQSTNSLAVIDRDLQEVVDNVDLAGMGCIEPWRARLTPSGSTLYVFCNGPVNLLALSLPDFSLKFSLSYSGGADDDIVFSPDEHYAFISSLNLSDIQVLDIEAQSIVSTIPLGGVPNLRSLSISPTGDRVYAAGAVAAVGKVYVIDAHALQVVNTIDFGHDAWDVLAAPDNQRLFVAGRFGSGIGIYDTKTFQRLDAISNTGDIYSLALSNDGSRVFAAESDSGNVDVYEFPSHRRLASIPVGGTLRDLAMDCSGKKLYVASWQSLVSVIDTQSYALGTIQTPGDTYGIAVCPQYQADIAARKKVDHDVTYPGGLLNYTISLSNLITATVDNVVITDTLPISLTYNEGSLSASSGQTSYLNGVISWTGSITPNTPVTVSYAESVPLTATIGTTVTNDAIIGANGKIYLRSATVDISRFTTFVPCASKACLPLFQDDFSNPGSGWDISRGDGYSMGYDNGVYYIAENQGWFAWTLQDFGVSDYRVEVDAWPAVSLDGSSAIMFGATDYGFYMFEVMDGYYSLWRNDAVYWQWTPLIDWTYSPAIHPGYQVNRLKVVRVGDNITVYANGQALGTVNDGTYHGTWSGMASEAYTGYFDGRFDNFILYAGDCLGAKSGVVPLNKSSTFGWTQDLPGVGHTGP